MANIDNLLKLGYTKEDINSFLCDKKIIISSDGTYIHDYVLLMNIIKRDNSEELFDYHNESINNMIHELFRLIRFNQNLLAYELAQRIYESLEIPEIKLIIDNIDYSIDNINYIVDPYIYTNDVVLNGLKEQERKMLLDFYCGDFVSGNKRLLQLAKIYVSQSPVPFSTYKAYLMAIKELKFNHTKIGIRKYEGALGEPIGVLNALLRCEDYVRAHEVIKTVYLNSIDKDFSIIWEVYRLMDIDMMESLDNNMENVYKQISLNSNGLNGVKEIVKKYDLPNVSGEQIDEMGKKYDYSIDYDKNYYQEYLKHKEKGKYEEARNDIIKFTRIMGERGIFCDYDYLIQETDILFFNHTVDPKERIEKHDELVNKGIEMMDKKKYEDALFYFNESFKYESKESISTYSKIGECYIELGQYEQAALVYKRQSNEYLYPIDYLHYIEALYRLEMYDEIFDIAEGYEYYYPRESALVHYILSICYIKRENYKLALEQLDICEIISMEYYDLALNYNYERGIIKDLIRGKDIDSYSLDDYYDHCFSKQVLNRIEALDINSIPEDGSLLIRIINENNNERIEDKLDFLLKLSKVLKEMNRRNDSLELLKYIEDIIKTSKLSPTDTEHFTVVLKNYRSL